MEIGRIRMCLVGETLCGKMLFVVKCSVLIDTLKFCGVMMADHLFNIGLGNVQTGHYDLRGEGVWGLDTNCY